MPTVTIRPTSQGAYNNWALIAGATKTIAESDASNTTYVSGAAWGPNGDGSARDVNSPRESYVLVDPALTGYVIDSVVVYASVLNYDEPPSETDNVNAYFVFVRLGGVNVDSSQLSLGPTGNWTAPAASLSRPGGGVWAAADFTALEAGFFYKWHHGSGGLPDDAAVADVWVDVTYHTAAAGTTGVLLPSTF